ncbi:MAG: serine acetyltransferase [Clostridia bacterium]|nr:serine acetyltransferase [Clostridia bacterium]MDY6183967.1 serine acetyltransferase [Eubacteriales bacterium]
MTYDSLLKELAAADDTVRHAGAHPAVPDRKTVIDILKDLQALLFPGYFRREPPIPLAELLAKIEACLTCQVECALGFQEKTGDAGEICRAFLSRLPAIKAMLLKDIEALYLGDPAAKSREEILICYPGFYAISIYRMAHELYVLGVPLLPRIMTEYAHEKTGIDIHAGATIGEYFFIDHGTGIVIGETTVIGHHVKLYQGVTLGAKSFETDENGNPIKNVKRHPNIGNHVVIYANATILGGETTVGDHSVIGGNVWLIHSVPPGTVVYYKEK